MDIERLKELKEEVFEDYKAYMIKILKDEDGKVYPSTVPLDECSPIGKDLITIINEAIARQSVKSEEVAEAIGDLLDMKEHWCADSTDNDAISIDLAIAALQAYQPEPPKGE